MKSLAFFCLCLAWCQLSFGAIIVVRGPVLAPSVAASFQAVTLDSSDWLSKSTDLTGLADGQSGSVSLWFKNTVAATSTIMASHDGNFSLNISSLGRVFVLGYTSAGVKILELRENLTGYNDGNWHHVAISWDLAVGAAHLYLGGVDQKEAGTLLTNDTIDYARTGAGFYVGSVVEGSRVQGYTGSLSEVWFSSEFIDFSNPTNLQRFRSAGGLQVSLGSDGSSGSPTTTAPQLYLQSAAASYGTNSGSGGNLTINGAFTDTAAP